MYMKSDPYTHCKRQRALQVLVGVLEWEVAYTRTSTHHHVNVHKNVQVKDMYVEMMQCRNAKRGNAIAPVH